MLACVTCDLVHLLNEGEDCSWASFSVSPLSCVAQLLGDKQAVAIIGAIDAINRLTELNFDISKLARVTDHCPEWTA